MESDLSAIKESGGGAPQPKPFTPSEFKPSAPAAPQKPAETKLNVPGYTGPEEAVFNPLGTLPSAGGATPPELPGGEAPAAPGGKKWLRPALLGGGGLIVLVGLGLAGYYFVYPLIFTAPTPLPPPPPPPTEEVAPPAEEPAPTVEPHTSLFAIPTESSETLRVTAVDTPLTIRVALESLSRVAAAPGTMMEVAATKDDGSPESFARMISLLVPELSETGLAAVFRGDFTLALYFNENGAWPVYIAQLQTGANLLDAQAAYAGFENSANLANLYLTDPGAQEPAWKDGQVAGRPTRYLPFAQAGASLNYGWLDDLLVVSTSFDGMKDAVRRLGL